MHQSPFLPTPSRAWGAIVVELLTRSRVLYVVLAGASAAPMRKARYPAAMVSCARSLMLMPASMPGMMPAVL